MAASSLSPHPDRSAEVGKQYLRPLWLGILFAMLAGFVVVLVSGIAGAAAGGAALGALLFTQVGQRWLDQRDL